MSVLDKVARFAVGDDVVIEGNASGRNGARGTVTHVGRLWVTVYPECQVTRKFNGVTGCESIGGNGGYCLLFSVAKHAAREARVAARKRFKQVAPADRDEWLRLSTSKLNRIAAILEETP